MRVKHGVLPVLIAVAAVLIAAGGFSVPAPAAVVAQEAPANLDLSFATPPVWSPADAVVRQLFDCHEQFGCVQQVMQANGASAQAVAYFRLRQQFLTSVIDSGAVKVGTEFSPWKANSNAQTVLLGGVPAVMTPALDGAEHQAETDPAFAVLKQQYPNLVVWTYDQVFESAASTAEDGMTFVFRFGLHDGCHACGTPYDARFRFTFNADLTFRGVAYVDIEPH